MDDSLFLILKLITKLQESKQCSTVMKTNKNKPTTEYNREHGNKPSHICQIILTRMPMLFKGERQSLKKNGDGKTGYPHTKVDPYTLIFLFWQPKLTNIVE